MIISLCGDEKDKKGVIKELKEVYKDKLVICDYFKLYFNTVVENEKVKYKLDSECDTLDNAYRAYSKYVDRIVFNKINELLNKNKDKIILLISNNVLSKDVNKISFFNKSDLKILITTEEKFNKPYSIFNHKKLYDKNKFDVIIDSNEKIDVKKLVKV